MARRHCTGAQTFRQAETAAGAANRGTLGGMGELGSMRTWEGWSQERDAPFASRGYQGR